MNGAGYKLDNSFKINHLSFGVLHEFDQIATDFPDAGVIHPLDGFEVTKPMDNGLMRSGFYLKAVPAIFVGNWWDKTLAIVETVVSRLIIAMNMKGK